MSGLSDEARGRRQEAAVRAERHHARPDPAQHEEGGGCTGAAVEQEGDRAVGVCGLGRVGDVEDLGRALALAVAQGEGAGGDAVVERALAEPERVPRDGRAGEQTQQAGDRRVRGLGK